jgi:hypothetical protein
LADKKRERIERIGPYLAKLRESKIDRLVETRDVLRDNAFWPETKGDFGQFYAPFDWINDGADIVLIGITPGKRQAKSALKALRTALITGTSTEEAARMAKQAASFEGDMRDIAAQLTNRFGLHKLFRLADVAELFGAASHRAHYTSLLRYPVLHWQTKQKKDRTKTTGWFDYSGGDSAFTTDSLIKLRN